MTHIIFEPCIGVKDTSCVDVCPVQAILPLEEVPEGQEKYIALNYTAFGFDPP